MTSIQLPDEQAAALRARAAASGLSLEEWLKSLAEEKEPPRPMHAAAEIALYHMRRIPPEMLEAMPEDGASQHDHYIYGWPKREE